MTWEYGVVDLSNDSTEVSDKPATLKGVYVNTVLSNHVCPIKDGTTTVFVLKAQLDAGSFVDFYETEFSNITVDPDDSATGNITLIYRSQKPY